MRAPEMRSHAIQATPDARQRRELVLCKLLQFADDANGLANGDVDAFFRGAKIFHLVTSGRSFAFYAL
jgi:hypothetical protein